VGSEYRPGVLEDFDRLYEETYPRLFGTLVTLLRDRAAAEDCVQEAYLRAFRAWGRWRPDAPAEAWLHRIAINVAVSHRRKEQLWSAASILRRQPQEESAPPPQVGDPDLLAELRALPPKQAAALVLRYLHGYSNREIAQSLGVPERTIASRLAAARARLQERLAETEESGTLPARRVSL
jgi:RNA polymerase sigma-70 factor (ECF subfamily)